MGEGRSGMEQLSNQDGPSLLLSLLSLGRCKMQVREQYWERKLLGQLLGQTQQRRHCRGIISKVQNICSGWHLNLPFSRSIYSRPSLIIQEKLGEHFHEGAQLFNELWMQNMQSIGHGQLQREKRPILDLSKWPNCTSIFNLITSLLSQ